MNRDRKWYDVGGWDVDRWRAVAFVFVVVVFWGGLLGWWVFFKSNAKGEDLAVTQARMKLTVEFMSTARSPEVEAILALKYDVPLELVKRLARGLGGDTVQMYMVTEQIMALKSHEEIAAWREKYLDARPVLEKLRGLAAEYGVSDRVLAAVAFDFLLWQQSGKMEGVRGGVGVSE